MDKGLRSADVPVHPSFHKMRSERSLRAYHKDLLAAKWVRSSEGHTGAYSDRRLSGDSVSV